VLRRPGRPPGGRRAGESGYQGFELREEGVGHRHRATPEPEAPDRPRFDDLQAWWCGRGHSWSFVARWVLNRSAFRWMPSHSSGHLARRAVLVRHVEQDHGDQIHGETEGEEWSREVEGSG